MAQTILLVDDDPSLTEILAEGLKTAGYRVAVAHDGVQAIQQACEAKPDLIVLDFHMPGGGGTAVYVGLRELGPTAETPIVFLTGVSIEEVKDSVPFGGRTYFVPKPVGLDEILPIVRAALGKLHP
jgi:DNA-binding response OmpR family regulator